MKKFAQFLAILLLLVSVVGGMIYVGRDLGRAQTKSVAPYTAPECQLTLLVTTAQGERVYRLTGPYTVVPSIIVVGRNGQVVIR